MTLRSDFKAEYGVKQVADQLRDRLRRYLEAQYHIRDTGLIEERRALLQEKGTIGQEPYLETTPMYQSGEPYSELGLPYPIGETLTELSQWSPGVGVFPTPYAHQAEALRAFFNDGYDLIVATGTGSGKTETFLFPILGHLLQEAAERPHSFRMPGVRALLLYPMNALVSDQVSRLRRLFGEERLAQLFRERYGRFPRFGMYTSRTPYPGPRNPEKDSRHLRPVLRYYLTLEDLAGARDEKDRRMRELLIKELKLRGRWPAKNLRAFYGTDGDRWDRRLETQPEDRELFTRHEMQQQCPDILVTNYSMLEYMFLRPIERSIFQQTREWLAADERNQLVLVLDEAHMYRGAGGAEVALLVRRLQARLDIPRERLRCILTSASLGNTPEAEEAAKAFAVGLTGRPAKPFYLVRGQREKRPPARPATPSEAAYLAEFDLSSFFLRTENPAGAVQAIAELAEQLGWPAPPPPPEPGANGEERTKAESELRRYLYRQLHGFGPLELVIAETTGKATALSFLTGKVFPNVEQGVAEQAMAALLALGTYAHSGDRAFLPTRAHLFFRGLPSLYACINPECDQRRYRPGEKLLLGRLYTEPRTRCTCKLQARVYEIYTHRDCGAVFLHVFGRGPRATFYWHEQGGNVGEVGKPLNETLLLVEPVHKRMSDHVEPIWLEMSTGRVETDPPADPSRYRLLYRPAVSGNRHVGPKRRRSAQRVDGNRNDDNSKTPFPVCPACTKRSGHKIMDLATKGEQPFANLVFEQLILQPATRKPSDQNPNGGRKVLLFSDGRQKAARLARDLPRDVEFDTFRQALALAVQRLNDRDREATLDQRMYKAFISVCHDYNLYFFDREGRSQEILLEGIERYRDLCDADLDTALEVLNLLPPDGYRSALLRQLCDPFYSLYAACAAVVQPTRFALRQIEKGLSDLPEQFRLWHLEPIVTAWIQALLERSAFDPLLNEEMRRRVDEYFRPVSYNEKIERVERLLREHAGLTEAQVHLIRERLYTVLTRSDPARGDAYLDPSSIVLTLALDTTWWQCASCGLTQHQALFGHCTWCGESMLEERPPDHPYMTSRKGYFRESLRRVLNGDRPVHLTAEEHTAQLSHRDVGVVYATTEEYELRFQDIPLGPKKPPIDVLSCTTTMEVGIDIGSLTAVGLRNVPPQRENYQQRSGRAGRRGAAVSTVVTYAQGGPHDNYYYHRPEEIISGEPRLPKVKVDNRRLARRHIHSYLIQTFFHAQLDALPQEEQERIAATRTHLMSALGTTEDFFAATGRFSLPEFRRWVKANIFQDPAPLVNAIARWLPDEICTPGIDGMARLAEKYKFILEVSRDFLAKLDELAPAYAGIRGAEGNDEEPRLLLDVLFDKGLLPSYAFPTDLCTFYIFEREGGRVRIKERPEQSKDKALSEYAPGRLVVVNKQTYRVGGIYVEGSDSVSPARVLFAGQLPSYTYCIQCTYVRLGPLNYAGETCPVCGAFLVTQEMIDPPGFSPEGGEPLNERDREQEISYATSAQFPTPVEADTYQWKKGIGPFLRYAHEENRRLVIVNKGPGELGFRVCESCGAAWPETQLPTADTHLRPFQVDFHVLQREGASRFCRGPLHARPVYLGYSFLTDILLLRFPLVAPLSGDPRHPWLHDALRTVAEALALSASLELDIDPGELSAGYRLMPPLVGEDPGAWLLADIYLFDTASGGAGYAAEAGNILPQVIDRAFALLRDCPERCERSCTKCLRHYGNRYWHERLDRHLGAGLLAYARYGEIPPVAAAAQQSWQLAPLQRYLELEGWQSARDVTISGTRVPLLVTAPSTGVRTRQRRIAVGTYPALLDTNADNFVHPLYDLDGLDDVTVVLLNDYVVARDLPSSYQQFLEATQC